uniref:Uncharacterized protein n=1 Tax=Oryza nivara TaxID=4536 RepID=A0A0E0FZG5_ORYNI
MDRVVRVYSGGTVSANGKFDEMKVGVLVFASSPTWAQLCDRVRSKMEHIVPTNVMRMEGQYVASWLIACYCTCSHHSTCPEETLTQDPPLAEIAGPGNEDEDALACKAAAERRARQFLMDWIDNRGRRWRAVRTMLTLQKDLSSPSAPCSMAAHPLFLHCFSPHHPPPPPSPRSMVALLHIRPPRPPPTPAHGVDEKCGEYGACSE